MHFTGIGQLLLDRHRRGSLEVLAEPRARVREPPGRQLDGEPIERVSDQRINVASHGVASYSSSFLLS
jgi:hypothetical protein